MGDRTFSAEDVIRIYESFLTPDEQKIVDEFFLEGVEGESLLPPVENLLNLLVDLLAILVSPLLGALAAVFGSLTLAALNAAIRGVGETNRILGNIIDAEEVDA